MAVSELLENFDINELETIEINGLEMKVWPEGQMAAHLPVLEDGMSIVTYVDSDGKTKKAIGFFRVDDLTTLHLNIARKRGTIPQHVAKIGRALAGHSYVPYSSEPPVITIEGGLVAGKNRYGAHESKHGLKSQFVDDDNKVWMWSAMCNFPLTEDGTVDLKSEAIFVYAFNENTRIFWKEEVVDEDLPFTVSNAFAAGLIKRATEYFVKQFLEKLNYATPNQALMDEILQEIDKDYCPVEVPSDDVIRRRVQTDFNKETANNSEHQIRSFRSTESEAAMERYFRFILAVSDLLSVGKDVTVYGKITNAKALSVVSGRKNVEARLEPMIKKMEALVNAFKNEKIGKLNWKWVSQNKDETSKGFWL